MMWNDMELKTICRVCLKSGEMESIFGANGEDTAISLKIKIICTSIEILHGTNMPDHICGDCIDDLEQAYRFHTNCESSDAILKSFVATVGLTELVASSSANGCAANVTDDDTDADADNGQATASNVNSNETNFQIIGNVGLMVMNEDGICVPNESTTTNDGDVDGGDDLAAALAAAVAGMKNECQDTTANVVDSIIEGVEFDPIDSGMLKVKVLGDDQCVEYRVKVEDVLDCGLLQNDDDHDDDDIPLISTDHEQPPGSPSLSKIMDYDDDNISDDIIVCDDGNSENNDDNDNDDYNDNDSNVKIESDSEAAQHSDADDPNTVICNIKPIVSNRPRSIGAAAATKRKSTDSRETSPAKRSPSSTDAGPQKECIICGNRYRFQHALDGHMRRHRNEKPFKCHICGKGFVINFELSRHMRTHTGQKPYACTYCDRRFSDFGSRVKHERTHTGERPYPCDVCGKAFAYSHVLTSHLLTHSGVKKFGCDKCGKRFTKSHHLKAHMNTHNRERPNRLAGSGASSSSSAAAAAAAAASGFVLSGDSGVDGDATGSNDLYFMTASAAASHDLYGQPLPSMQPTDEQSLIEDNDHGFIMFASDDDRLTTVDDPTISICGPIITDSETGENFLLDMSELEEDEQAAVHLLHFDA